MSPDEKVAEALVGLRWLMRDPSPERAQALVADWPPPEMYDTRDAAWRPQTPLEGT
jgi:hypothetical protein